LHPALGTATVAGLAGGAALAYAAGYEVRAFQLREDRVPVLAPGTASLRVLHISDLHMTPRQGKKVSFLRSLADLEPDLVVSTGDHLAHPDVVPTVGHALEPLSHLPGVFVLGSNDYYAPQLKNPARYLLPDSRTDHHGPELPWRELVDVLTGWGWVDLDNSAHRLRVGAGRRGDAEAAGLDIAFVGVDDAHLDRDDYQAVAGPPPPEADLSIGVTHAPYIRVLDAMAGDGHPLIIAGHTHGGQLCIPGYGALTTNCDLDTRRAKGLSRHGASYLHVSAGLGTSPYAPVRFACPPEATLLTLTSP
jgi:predicted MPP superfamily phosphohydrolase